MVIARELTNIYIDKIGKKIKVEYEDMITYATVKSITIDELYISVTLDYDLNNVSKTIFQALNIGHTCKFSVGYKA